MFEKIYDLTKRYPHILEFYKPAYSRSKFLSENGSLPDPLFDACPACKTEWAFDYTGHIYSCTATVGKDDESLGTFYPEVNQISELINIWESRDVVSIPECKECSVQLACGGGCGSVAKNKSGKVVLDFYSSECPPCEALAPKFESLAGLYGNDIKFLKIFRQKNKELADQLEVRSSPTLLFFENGYANQPTRNK